jgi:hypothetical protein
MKTGFRISALLVALVALFGLPQEAATSAADSAVSDTATVDTAAIDSTKIVEDVHPEDIVESGFEVNVSGYVRVNAFYDVEGMRNTESFRPIEIPMGSENTEQYKGLYLGARQSRIGVESIAPTRIGRLRTYIEGDFVGPQETFTFRLRHAFGQAGYWTVGQTWSTAMDLSALPKTVDFEGPNSAVLVRQGLVRFERRFDERYVWGISVENPKPEITYVENRFESADRQTNFDVTTRLKLEKERGHAQLSGIFRVLSYTDSLGRKHYEVGGGGVLSARFNTHRGGKILAQGIWGLGISRYINGLANAGLDGVVFSDGEFRLFEVVGWYAAYQWNWNRSGTVNSTVVVGSTGIPNSDDMPPDFYRRGDYATFDTFWRLLRSFELGFGLTMGRRVNNDGAEGTATRIGAIGKFTF